MEKILLNNQVYNKDNVAGLFYANESPDSWRNTIHAFLKNWFEDSEFIVNQTSGSTGEAKEILLPKTAMRNSARMTNAFFGLDKTKTALLSLPASYIAGKMMLVRAIVGGFNILAVEPKANPFENLSVTIDFAPVTPYQLIHSIETLRSSQVQNIIVGGGHVSAQLETSAADLPGALYETYGMTETASHIAVRRFNGAGKSDFFTVLDGVSIRQDARGCLMIFAPHLSEKELITNDIVELKNERNFRWLGRADLVINSGGVKIFPEQVEKKLEKLIAANYFIVSLPDERLGNKVMLIIEGNPYAGKQLAQLEAQLKALLNKYEMPKQIVFVPCFAYSASNKVLRKKTMEADFKI